MDILKYVLRYMLPFVMLGFFGTGCSDKDSGSSSTTPIKVVDRIDPVPASSTSTTVSRAVEDVEVLPRAFDGITTEYTAITSKDTTYNITFDSYFTDVNRQLEDLNGVLKEATDGGEINTGPKTMPNGGKFEVTLSEEGKYVMTYIGTMSAEMTLLDSDRAMVYYVTIDELGSADDPYGQFEILIGYLLPLSGGQPDYTKLDDNHIAIRSIDTDDGKKKIEVDAKMDVITGSNNDKGTLIQQALLLFDDNGGLFKDDFNLTVPSASSYVWRRHLSYDKEKFAIERITNRMNNDSNATKYYDLRPDNLTISPTYGLFDSGTGARVMFENMIQTTYEHKAENESEDDTASTIGSTFDVMINGKDFMINAVSTPNIKNGTKLSVEGKEYVIGKIYNGAKSSVIDQGNIPSGDVPDIDDSLQLDHNYTIDYTEMKKLQL
jgi:hypothetical protein